tara:strand:- start:28725 stop:29681 length:957 start_codon:yes stop_codon:yes gene_type:complete
MSKMLPKTLIYHPDAAEYADRLAGRAPDLPLLATSEPEQLALYLPDAEILICGPKAVPGIASAQKLRWIQLTMAGAELLAPEAHAIGHLMVTNARGLHAELMSDHAMAAMVMLQWDFPKLFRNQAERRWERSARMPLAGRVLGVVGSGSIGSEIGRRASEFGMTVYGVRRSGTGTPPGFTTMYGPAELDQLLPQCDFVCVVVPATPETDRMFGAAQFAAMKPGAYFINIARGSVVDEPALIAALQERRIAGAALDVFAEEPPRFDNPLWTMPNVIITPHVSGMAASNEARLVDLFLDNLSRFQAGQPLRNPVDPRRGY